MNFCVAPVGRGNYTGLQPSVLLRGKNEGSMMPLVRAVVGFVESSE